MKRALALGWRPTRLLMPTRRAFLVSLLCLPSGAPVLAADQGGRVGLPSHALSIQSQETDQRAWCVRFILERKYDRAIQSCSEAIASESSDPEPFSNRGTAFLLANDSDRPALLPTGTA